MSKTRVYQIANELKMSNEDVLAKLKELEIMEEFVEKWNGQLPSTMLNDKISAIFGVD